MCVAKNRMQRIPDIEITKHTSGISLLRNLSSHVLYNCDKRLRTGISTEWIFAGLLWHITNGKWENIFLIF